MKKNVNVYTCIIALLCCTAIIDIIIQLYSIKNKFKEIIINISENKPGGYHSTYDYYSSTLVPYILYFTLYKTVEWSPSALLWMINVMWAVVAAATAKLLQSCPTLCDHIDGFSRQEHWSGLPFPSPVRASEKWKWSRSVVSDSGDSMDCSPPGSSIHGIFQARVLEWGAICLLQNESRGCALYKIT